MIKHVREVVELEDTKKKTKHGFLLFQISNMFSKRQWEFFFKMIQQNIVKIKPRYAIDIKYQGIISTLKY
jgi:NAD-dependent DNA ligase